jgi:hypothetical protein
MELEMIPVQQQFVDRNSPSEEEQTIVRLTLYPSQTRQFRRLLDGAFNRTGIHGVLLTIDQTQDLNAGHLFLELQAARLDGATTRKIQQLISASRKELK